MKYQQTTHVPNVIFDKYLPQLSFSELKILLYIIRQTYGWKTKKGKRKTRDRITHGQFKTKTGLSRRIISQTIQSLITKELIQVTNYYGNLLHLPSDRKGKISIYYAPYLQTYAKNNTKVGKQKHQAMHNRVYNKTNDTKLKGQKEISQPQRISDWERIQQIRQFQHQ